jgi:hypothetical protein
LNILDYFRILEIIFNTIYLYNILSLSGGGCPFHPSKFLIPEEEDDGTGGGGQLMAVATVYPNVHGIQSCRL